MLPQTIYIFLIVIISVNAVGTEVEQSTRDPISRVLIQQLLALGGRKKAKDTILSKKEV